MGSRLAGLALLVVTSAAAAQDTVRVQANGAPRWGANVRLVQEVALGQLDGPIEYALGRISGGVMTADGGFYLYDASDRQVRRYSRAGRFLNLVGRRGSGPGEYQGVTMAGAHDSLLVVGDSENARITFFRPDGSVWREHPVTRFGFYEGRYVVDAGGLTYGLVTAPGLASDGYERKQYVRSTSNGVLLDSLPIPDAYVPRNFASHFALSTSDGTRWNFVERRLTKPYSLGGTISATTLAYRIIVARTGQPILVIDRPQPPLPLGREERQDWLRAVDFIKQRAQRVGRPGIDYEIPTTKPPIRDILSDHRGRIWVEVAVVAERRNEPQVRPDGSPQLLFWKERTTYDVFSPAGDYLGRVAFPPEHILLDIRDNRLLALTKGADGEDRVIVFRMDVPGGR